MKWKLDESRFNVTYPVLIVLQIILKRYLLRLTTISFECTIGNATEKAAAERSTKCYFYLNFVADFFFEKI
jgi:hypothetical protein